MSFKTFIRPLLAAALLLSPLTAHADLPGQHPYYLHALGELRTARWMLENRPGDEAVETEEASATREIDAAIGELKRAAIDDGKDIHDHPPVDLPRRNIGRLHKAADLLRRAQREINQEEDDPEVLGLQKRAADHVSAALNATKAAMQAPTPAEHPAYLHALSDLRDARWMLEHRPGDAAVSGQEDTAIHEIEAAIGEIKHAAIDDGKDIADHTAIDLPKDHAGRLHYADQLLHKVRRDVDQEEDDPASQGLKQRALQHIQAATDATRAALHDSHLSGH